MVIRAFQSADAEAVSDLIRLTMRISNARDYSPERLLPLMQYFTPAKVAELNRDRACLVAEEASVIVGTAAAEGGRICTFFVHPEHQGRGIGTELLATLESQVRALGFDCLTVEASLTGVPFYAARGYWRTGKVLDGSAGPQIEFAKTL